MHSITWMSLVDLVWDREVHVDIDLNEESMEGIDVDDQPTPIVKIRQVCEYAQLLSNFPVEFSSKFLVVDVMNM